MFARRFGFVTLMSSLLCLVVSSGSVFGHTVKAWVRPHDNVFPSMIVATSTLHPAQTSPKSKSGTHSVLPKFFGVTFTADKPNTKVSVTIEATKYFDTSSVQTTLTDAGHKYQICPDMQWKYQTLEKNEQQGPLNIVFKVKVDDGKPQQFVKTVTVRSVHDCPLSWSSQDDPSKKENVPWMFSAYVNEDHPWIDHILHEAITEHIVGNFVGQQQGPQVAMQQVFAIWHALQRRGFTYSNIPTTPNLSAKVFSQDVRLLGESLATAQGNCIDGTVVFASFLRKIGIEPAIVLIPHHAFLEFSLNNGNKQVVYGLETTMIGKSNVSNIKDLRQMYLTSANTFTAALQMGTRELVKVRKVMQDGKPHPGYAFLSIARMRELGISPIPSQVSQNLSLPSLNAKKIKALPANEIPKVGETGRLILSLHASCRKALLNSSLVLRLHNNYPWPIKATVSKTDAANHIIKSKVITLPAGPNSMREIGWVQGIRWHVGDHVLVQASGYQSFQTHLIK